MPNDWLELTAGWPAGTNDPWNYPEAIPDPLKFFRALCWELGGVQLGALTIVENHIEPREEQLLRGFQGNAQVGLRLTEHRSLYSSMFPIEVRYATYGLPGVEVVWAYHWAYAGQAGHSVFHHRRLQARFATPAAQAHFTRCWQTAFGQTPVFQPTLNVF